MFVETFWSARASKGRNCKWARLTLAETTLQVVEENTLDVDEPRHENVSRM